MDLDQPVRRVVGGGTAKALSALGVETVGDLLRHYPRRYASRGELTDLSRLAVDEHVTVMADVAAVTVRNLDHVRHGKSRRPRTIVEVVVTDGKGRLTLTFFNQRWHADKLQAGRRGLFSGKVGSFRGALQLTHPDYVLIPGGGEVDEIEKEAFARELIPVYPASAALASWRIAQSIRIVLDQLDNLPDPLPQSLRASRGLIGLREAFEGIHRPDNRADLYAATERLRYDEAFLLQVELARRRHAASALPAVPRTALDEGLLTSFDAQLPFDLTDGQRRVGAEIAADLALAHPMHRLLQGEVGAGKTVIALRAMLAVLDSGGQAALLAPTEVLAQQHYRSITELLGPLAQRGLLGGSDIGTQVALVTGSQPAATRRKTLLDVVSGDAGIVVGTHALLEERVSFADLGLVVVDEQHRFGVEQRAVLTAKSLDDRRPHVLVMTATPIPRTVAMTVFGDLEVSTLTELPSGRAAVTTHVVPVDEKPHYLDRAWQRIREEVAAGHQAFVVCPRIGDAGDVDGGGPGDDGSDALFDVESTRRTVSVLELVELLRDGPLHGLRIEVLHGRLPADAKDLVMRRFAAGEIDVLVATTVVEVGVDVPNASVMVVMDADRFGVSQLHQLRGRIGRGAVPGVCLLVTEVPAGTVARERLDAVAATTDGFELSRVDLQQRREGDVLGAAQSGTKSSLRLLSALRDEDVIRDARADATELVAADPTLGAHPLLAAALQSLVGADRADYLEKG